MVSFQDSYRVTYQAIGPDSEPLGDEEMGCVALHPAEQCVIKVNDTKYPPGTEFKVRVYSEKDGVKSDPVKTTTNTREQTFWFKEPQHFWKLFGEMTMCPEGQKDSISFVWLLQALVLCQLTQTFTSSFHWLCSV